MARLYSLALFLSALPGIVAAPGNLISNDGFETGELSPWVEYKNDGSSLVQDNSKSTEYFKFQARTGTKFLFAVPDEDSTYGVSQEVTLSAGTTYTFDAYFSLLQWPNSQLGCEVSALIDGTVVASRATRVGMLGGIRAPSYYNVTGTYESAVTGPVTAAIDLSCPNGAIGVIIGLDDISLQ